MKIYQILAIILPAVLAAGTTDATHTGDTSAVDEDAGAHGDVAHAWDYKTNGADWPKLKMDGNQCAGSNQSPIDLKNSWDTLSSRYDNFNKLYENQVKDIEVVWNGHTSQIAVNKEGQNLQTFDSNHAEKAFGSHNRFTGVQFHFHHKSEHTVEGKYHDLEMHTVHLPPDGKTKNGFIASAMGLMFSVKDYTRSVTAAEQSTIDTFFESLQWTTTDSNPKVAEVPYGDLMMMADMDNRYTYVGSVTTPPCAQNVYWNVLRTVYPIRQKHLDQFMNQLKRGGLEVTGNNREIQATTSNHRPWIITGGSALSNTGSSAQKIDLNISMSGASSGSGSGSGTVLAAGSGSTTSSTNGYLETVTILLIVSILFLLIAVLVVVKNSFDKRPPYSSVDGQTTERQNEGGEAEQEMHAVYRE